MAAKLGGHSSSDRFISDSRSKSLIQKVAVGVDGLTLFTDVVTDKQARSILGFVDAELKQGRKGKLYGKTYTTPVAYMKVRSQSREMLQFGAYTHSNRVDDAKVRN